MSDEAQISIEKCCCGHKGCSTYWLKGIGRFCQGSGFDKDEAEELAKRFNCYTGLVASLEKLARLGNGNMLGNSDGNMIARSALANIND